MRKKNRSAEVKIESVMIESIRKSIVSPSVQMHIPGHTRGKVMLKEFRDLLEENIVSRLDTTDEFDNIGTLHPESGVIGKAQENASKIFGSRRSFFLLNGSTVGNIALGLSYIKPGDKVIVGRNCHRSVVTAMILTGANPIWLCPERIESWGIWGQVSVESVVKSISKNPDVKLVWITSPTYEGVVSDVRSIARECRNRGIALFVDEAHGALWSFSENLPESALNLGADAVVHSMHKTGGSFTQSSILHVTKDSCIDDNRVAESLRLVHTTSPSIMLLTSLDAACVFLDSKEGKSYINKAYDNAKYIRESLKGLSNILILDDAEGFEIDKTKLFIKIKGVSGLRLQSILKFEYNIEIESRSDEGILALSNIGNTRDEIEYFIKSLKEIANRFSKERVDSSNEGKFIPLLSPMIKMSPSEGFYSDKERVKKEESEGRISGELIALCPPGIFILVPGELIRQEHFVYLKDYSFIEVIKED